MDCLRSFNFIARGQANFVSPDVKTWFVGAQEFWAFKRSGSSVFNVQGFKNINVFGVKVIGDIGTEVTPLLGGAIPTDWAVGISINGEIARINGFIDTTNDFNITQLNSEANNFNLSRFNPEVEFSSPIESVQSISIFELKANGSGGQTSGNLNLQYNLNFIVYYKYEGE